MAEMDFKWNEKPLMKSVTEWQRRVLYNAAIYLVNTIQNSIRRTPRLVGISYQRGGKEHHPSVPGHPPAVDIGRLIGSISYSTSWAGPAKGVVRGKAKRKDGVTRPKKVKDIETVVVGTAVPYGLHLEMGTKDIEARPFLRPAIKKGQRRIAKLIKIVRIRR